MGMFLQVGKDWTAYCGVLRDEVCSWWPFWIVRKTMGEIWNCRERLLRWRLAFESRLAVALVRRCRFVLR